MSNSPATSSSLSLAPSPEEGRIWGISRSEESHQVQVETLRSIPYWETLGQKPGSGLSSSLLPKGLGLCVCEPVAVRELPVFMLCESIWVNRGCQRPLLPCCWKGCWLMPEGRGEENGVGGILSNEKLCMLPPLFSSSGSSILLLVAGEKGLNRDFFAFREK